MHALWMLRQTRAQCRITDWLQSTPDPPEEVSVESALKNLQGLGAVVGGPVTGGSAARGPLRAWDPPKLHAL